MARRQNDMPTSPWFASVEVVILAGGKGTRMRPLTYTRPKPLLPLLNQPLLQHIIDRLPDDVDKIILPVGYLREQIDQYFADRPDERVVLVEENDPLGTGGAIKNCEKHLTDTFLVYNGDVVTDLDLQAFRRFHAKTKAKATISLWPVKEPWHFGVVHTTREGRIDLFVEKPPQGKEPSNLINAGHYLLEPSVLDDIPRGRMFSIERELYQPWAAKGKPIFGFPFQGYWVDCGRPESFLEAQDLLFKATKKTNAVETSARVDTTAKITSSSIGQDCVVLSGATVRRSMLLASVSVGKGVTIRDSIVGEGAEIEDGVTLDGAVVGDHAIVEAGTRIVDQKVGMRPEHVEA